MAILGLLLVSLTLACGPSAAPPVASPTTDPFVVVRATSQAAYTAGRAELDKGQLEQALVDLDTAKTNDPDNRADIQQALDETLARLQALTTTAGTAAAGTAQGTEAPQRTIVVATAPAAAPAVSPAARGPSPSAITGLATWTDPQGRFTIGAPAGWTPVNQPQSLVGAAVVEFRDPTQQAECDVAVDSSSRAVSPELYAASIELAMQQQVPGYAGEQVVPGSTGGSASIRRVFTFTQRDATGREYQARGVQVVILKGSTPYIITGSAPAAQFNDQFGAIFDQMVESFRFS